MEATKEKKIVMTKELWDAYTRAMDEANMEIAKRAEEQKMRDEEEVKKIVKVLIKAKFEHPIIKEFKGCGDYQRLSFTREGMEYVYRPGKKTSRKPYKWKYTTSSEEYAEYFEDIKRIFNEAKYYVPEQIDADGYGICVEVVFDDHTRRSTWYDCGDVAFSRLISKDILMEMVPEREKEFMESIGFDL